MKLILIIYFQATGHIYNNDYITQFYQGNRENTITPKKEQIERGKSLVFEPKPNFSPAKIFNVLPKNVTEHSDIIEEQCNEEPEAIIEQPTVNIEQAGTLVQSTNNIEHDENLVKSTTNIEQSRQSSPKKLPNKPQSTPKKDETKPKSKKKSVASSILASVESLKLNKENIPLKSPEKLNKLTINSHNEIKPPHTTVQCRISLPIANNNYKNYLNGHLIEPPVVDLRESDSSISPWERSWDEGSRNFDEMSLSSHSSDYSGHNGYTNSFKAVQEAPNLRSRDEFPPLS